MPYDNVVPIDADVARLLARRQIRFRWFVCVLTAVWIALLVPVLALTPLPPIGPFVALAILVVLAEHRFVLFGDETSMSASIIVVVASVFVFASTSPLAGPMLVASLGGLYLPHLRRGERLKALFTVASMGIAALGAAGAAILVTSTDSARSLSVLVPVAISLAIYWVLNNAVVASYQTVRLGHSLTSTTRTFLTSDTEILFWAFAGSIGAWVAAGKTTAAISFIAATVAMWNSKTLVGRLPKARRLPLRVASARCDALLIWLVALALGSARGTSMAFAIAIAVPMLIPRYPTGTARWITIGFPLLAVAVAPASPLLACAVFVLSAATAAALPRATPAWAVHIAVGTTAWILLSRSFSIVNADSHSPQASAMSIIGPVALSMMALSLSTLLRASRHDVFVAIGLATPTTTDIAALVVVCIAAFLANAHPVPLLAGFTAYLAARCVLPVSRPRTSVSASR